jgi:two-component system NtrC family response regulator
MATAAVQAARPFPAQAAATLVGLGQRRQRRRQLEGPWIPLNLASLEVPENGLLPLSSVREMAMLEVEARYLRHLVAACRGNFQRAQTMSGLSRARLYDLLKKHSMSITGS